MKDMSLFVLKNSFGAKMKKGFKNFCNGEGSTSTLDQNNLHLLVGGGTPTAATTTCMAEHGRPEKSRHPTLEEMILQLEMEEQQKIAKNNSHNNNNNNEFHHRMSCVNSSDILKSARNALNQYPRFSLDGKDSMYRSSFTNNSAAPIRAAKLMQSCTKKYDDFEKSRKKLPCVVGGESVIWCKPGVVGKLMGLDAMPIPLNSNYRRERLSAIIKRQNLRKRQEMEIRSRTRRVVGSCSRTGYCVTKQPLELDVTRFL
ncbi:hypothetical protein ACP275_11G078200 [Erythranthe tilingii]